MTKNRIHKNQTPAQVVTHFTPTCLPEQQWELFASSIAAYPGGRLAL